MRMRTWHFYDQGTGNFIGGSYSAASDEFLTMNTPAGCGARENVPDWQTKRVLPNGELVEHTPQPPDEDHEWNGAAHAFVLKPEVLRKIVALREIRELESSAIRTLLELADSPSEDVRARIKEKCEQIARLANDSGLRKQER